MLNVNNKEDALSFDPNEYGSSIGETYIIGVMKNWSILALIDL